MAKKAIVDIKVPGVNHDTLVFDFDGRRLLVEDAMSIGFLVRSKRDRDRVERLFEPYGATLLTHTYPRGYGRKFGDVKKRGKHYVVEIPSRHFNYRRFPLKIFDWRDTEEGWREELVAEAFGIETTLPVGIIVGKKRTICLDAPIFSENAVEVAETFAQTVMRGLEA